MKRMLDIGLSLTGMLALSPFLPFLALLIKVDSRGPVFYLCDRVGKDGRLFKMYKFRTMYETPAEIGPSLAPQGDPRVTPVGRLLRRTKLNEFPQLINIFKGDMSFVGPRPEAPDLAALYPAYAKEIFTIKPGLVGPNQIIGRNEEEWYPDGVDPQQYYIEVILPKKLSVDLNYVRQPSMRTDLKYILLGLQATIFKALDWEHLLRNRSQAYLLGIDVGLTLFSFSVAYGLITGTLFDSQWRHFIPLLIAVRLACFVYFGLYNTLIRHISYHDITRVFQSVTVGSLFLIVLSFFFDLQLPAKIVLFNDWLFLICLMSAVRFNARLLREWQAKRGAVGKHRRRVLIYGAGDAGALAYQSLMAEKEHVFDVIGFLDDDTLKRNKMLYGKKVLGNRHNLELVAQLYEPDEVFLAIPGASPDEIGKVMQACQNIGLPCHIFPTIKGLQGRLGQGNGRSQPGFAN